MPFTSTEILMDFHLNLKKKIDVSSYSSFNWLTIMGYRNAIEPQAADISRQTGTRLAQTTPSSRTAPHL